MVALPRRDESQGQQIWALTSIHLCNLPTINNSHERICFKERETEAREDDVVSPGL